MSKCIIPFRVDNIGINLNGSLVKKLKEEIGTLRFLLAQWGRFKTKKKVQEEIDELENRILYLTEHKDIYS